MDSLPNEVLRILIDHLTFKQKKSLYRVSRIWAYLILTFPIPIPRSYKCVKEIKADMPSIRPQFMENMYSVHHNKELLIIGCMMHVRIFDIEGCHIMNIKVNSSNVKVYIRSIAVNSKNQTIIIGYSDKINIFDILGNCIKEFKYCDNREDVPINCIAVDEQSDKIIVANNKDNKIQIFDFNGNFLSSLEFNTQIRFVNIYVNKENSNIIFTCCKSQKYMIYVCNCHGIRIRKFIVENMDNSYILSRNNLIFVFDIQPLRTIKYDRMITIFDANGQLLSLLNMNFISGGQIKRITCLSNGTIVCTSSIKILFLEPEY